MIIRASLEKKISVIIVMVGIFSSVGCPKVKVIDKFEEAMILDITSRSYISVINFMNGFP